jgi:hypothetical protein
MAYTHSPSEWAAFLSLGVSAHATFSVPYFLLVDADWADFDPRPAVRAVLESGRLDPALIAVVNVKHTVHAGAETVRHIPRDVGLTLAALLILTIPTGSTR